MKMLMTSFVGLWNIVDFDFVYFVQSHAQSHILMAPLPTLPQRLRHILIWKHTVFSITTKIYINQRIGPFSIVTALKFKSTCGNSGCFHPHTVAVADVHIG